GPIQVNGVWNPLPGLRHALPRGPTFDPAYSLDLNPRCSFLSRLFRFLIPVPYLARFFASTRSLFRLLRKINRN
ncbi:MAG: hypothetical protein KAY32_09655, partial [Candidatus Eisenbacteria sp.]|nr:hypothetical protein [Candidatus Eisenbacteria bacterium]